MTSDIAIAQSAKMLRISQVAQRYDIEEEYLEPYGHYKAKISLDFLDTLKDKPDGKLIMVTAINPTPAGEGKTTTTIGLGDALNRIGKKAIICLREPSMGPVFGMKGGAAGGGYSQVIPMEDINLHFTGDISAVALANNLLAFVQQHVRLQSGRLWLEPDFTGQRAGERSISFSLKSCAGVLLWLLPGAVIGALLALWPAIQRRRNNLSVILLRLSLFTSLLNIAAAALRGEP